MVEKEYIEREAIAKHIDQRFGEVSTPFVVREIRNFPTADVAEVKRGEWVTRKSIHNEEFYVCSDCMSATDDIYRYCPNCGAKMDGGIKND